MTPTHIDIRPGGVIRALVSGQKCTVVDGAEQVPVVADNGHWLIVKMDDGEEYEVTPQAIDRAQVA